MSTYYHGNINGHAGSDHGPDPETVFRLAEGLLEALHAELPGLVVHGEVIMAALDEAAADGGPPNRGRIRSSLEAISIGAPAGTGSLAFTQQLVRLLDL
ncbi:hypothetical protein [Streptomyces cellostaticus]|uniref:hypothetical protein n=1 Tax=Streptomyces TaxID=1883 RepID=UPI00202690B2|nr:hypothetical protein [Streptomyces cellostaticus]